MRNIILTIMMMAATVAYPQTDSLQTYIMAAINNNPEVMAKWYAYQAALQGVCPAGTLGDPEVSVNFYTKPMTQVNGKQVASISLMQMFPWFGTMKAAMNEKMWQAETVYQRYREGGVNLAYQVENQWFAMIALKEKMKTIDKQRALLKNIERIALYKFKSPSTMKGGNMSDQLRLQAEEARLDEQIASVESQLQLMRQQFNLLLHRDTASSLSIPDTIIVREMPAVSWDEIEKNSPSLTRIKAEGESYIAQSEKARRMGMPMIGLGVQYMLNSKRDALSDGAMESMNGNDMWMGMVKVTLPIYRRKIKAQRSAASLMKQSADESYSREVDVLRSQYLWIEQRAADVQRKIALYDREMDILDHTLLMMKSEYTAGTTSLTDIIQTQREHINYAFSKFEAQATYNTIVAEYEKLASVNDHGNRQQQLKKD